MAYALFGDPNARVLGADVPARPEPAVAPGILEEICRPGAGILKKREGFLGRRFLFDRVDTFLQDSQSGYLVVFGDPGIGKSAFLAELSGRRDYLSHFNIRAEGFNDARQLQRNLCAQLIARYGLPYQGLRMDGGFLSEVLEQVAERARGRKVVICIDALDEADSAEQRDGVNVLCLPRYLPDGVHVIATSRGLDQLPLRTDVTRDNFFLRQDSAENMADIEAYLRCRLEDGTVMAALGRHRLAAETFVKALREKSQGNFMYLHYFFQDLVGGAFNGSLDGLPLGLNGYYEEHWRLMGMRERSLWLEVKVPILVALCTAAGPLTLDELARFSGQKQVHVMQVLGEWAQFLHRAETEGRGFCYRIYHASFAEFIAAMDGIAGQGVDLDKSRADRLAAMGAEVDREMEAYLRERQQGRR